MKSKSIASIGLMVFASIATNNAYADEFCSLSITPSVVYPGQSYTFNVNIRKGRLFPGPLDPQISGPFNVTFYGTKNGVDDIGPSGWLYPTKKAGFGDTTLDGFMNPGGTAVAGTYTRYAILSTDYGTGYCRTNEVAAVLIQ